MSNTNTRKLVIIAILSALSFVLMFFQFPLLPAASFLKIDFSIIPILLGLVIYDLKSAYAVLLLRTLLKLILNNEGVGELIGLPMNIVAMGVFVLAFAMFWKKDQTRRSYITASVVGTTFLTLSMLALNYVFAIPLYAKFANFDIAKFIGVANYLLAMVIPFNLIEGVILSLAFAVVFVVLKPVIKRYI
ncbi:ECF transporter S component [Streptococcus thoraltensis]|uniref:ECF transporter S component n=1 Tax=Streptococcus thoraltensis TaxID=55085 RepID=UPI001F584ABA|nr:ECF transporter S component [Streptococcus thoraltensis]